MGKRKRLTYIEVLLILAIFAILVVWLFPRFLKMLDSNSAEVGSLRLPTGISNIERNYLSSDQVLRLLTFVGKTSWKPQALISKKPTIIVNKLSVNSQYILISIKIATIAARHLSVPNNMNPKLS